MYWLIQAPKSQSGCGLQRAIQGRPRRRLPPPHREPSSIRTPLPSMTGEATDKQHPEAAAADAGRPAAGSGPGSEDAAGAAGEHQAKPKKVLSEKKLKRLKEAHERRGIVYVSRIPPHMKPQKLRHLLSQHGEIGRVYCTPEDQLARHKRKKKGGNTGEPLGRRRVEGHPCSCAQPGCPGWSRSRPGQSQLCIGLNFINAAPSASRGSEPAAQPSLRPARTACR